MLKGVVRGKNISVNISRTNQVNQCKHIKEAQFKSQKTHFGAPNNFDQLDYICKDSLPVICISFFKSKYIVLDDLLGPSNKSNIETFPEFLLCTQVKI